MYIDEKQTTVGHTGSHARGECAVAARRIENPPCFSCGECQKSEGWVWSNQTTTGCGNCYYCWNGRCAYAARCYGTEMRIVDGRWQAVPIDSNVGAKVPDSPIDWRQ